MVYDRKLKDHRDELCCALRSRSFSDTGKSYVVWSLDILVFGLSFFVVCDSAC